MKRLMPLKEDFYYLQFPRGGDMPHRVTWKSTRVGQESKGVNREHCKSLYYYNCGKLLGGNIPIEEEAKQRCWDLWLEGL